MFKNFKTIRAFYKLSKVKPFLIFLMFLTLIVPAVLSVWTPVILSNTITAITVYDFTKAVHQTILGFGIIVISAISYFLYHLVSVKVNRIIITNFQIYIYQNVKSNKNVKSINTTILKDISTCASFNKNIIYKFCFFIKAVIILSIIFYYSYILALSIIGVSIVSFLFLKLTDRKIQSKTQELSQYENVSLDLFNSICGGDNAEQSYNLETALKDKYFKYVEQNIKTTNSISLYYNINNNFISLILKLAVFVSTLFLIGQVQTTELTLSVYLILTPYLTSSAENLISFFDIFSEIALMDNILKQFDSLKYISEPKKETPISIDSYNLYFYNATTGGNQKIKDINLKINFKDCVCFVSEEQAKLEEIFNIITKKVLLSSGGLFLGDKNISDFNSQTINRFIASVTPNEQFFNISIYENLYLVCPSRNKIFKEMKNLRVSNIISSFDEKYNTVIDDSFSSKQKFVLGLARAYLSGAKIINVFMLPENLSKSEREQIKFMLGFIKKHCTVICFFHQPTFREIFDKIYYFEKNKISDKNNE